MNPVRVIAIDFDGTLCLNAWPEIGRPRKEIIDAAKFEKERGSKIILYTMREGDLLQEAVDWCKEQGLIFDAINDNVDEWKEYYGNNPRKIGATEYWDDRAVSFEWIFYRMTNLCKKGEIRMKQVSLKDTSVTFEEMLSKSYRDENHKVMIFYFTASKVLLEKIYPDKYPEATGMEIRLEKRVFDGSVLVEISPTRYNAEDEGYIDYDWNEIDIPQEEVDWLINLVPKYASHVSINI